MLVLYADWWCWLPPPCRGGLAVWLRFDAGHTAGTGDAGEQMGQLHVSRAERWQQHQ